MKTNLDKKFDQHFKSSFEGFEALPSADSWDKISRELEKKPTKKPLIFWSAAASILLVMSVGIGLYINKPFGEIKSKTDVAIVPKAEKLPVNEITKKGIFEDVTIEKNAAIKAGLKLDHQTYAIAKKEEDREKNTVADATEIPKKEVEVFIESGESFARIDPTKNISVITEQKLTSEIDQKTINSTERMGLTSASIGNQKVDKEKVTARKFKLSSVGDLVNLVVAQVDKREDKIIKVSKTEEGENEITGINLGLFKFNKAEK